MFEKSMVTLRHIQNFIYTRALPFTCLFCGQPSDRQQDLCSACLQDLPIIAQSCPRCANKILSPALCSACLHHPPPFSAAFALFAYEQPLVNLILQLKFNRQLAYARILGELLTEKIRTEWYRNQPLPDLLMPVPLHPKRLQERGFNQAFELARPLARALALELDGQSAQRLENTPPQSKLPAEQRRSNLQNTFTVKRVLAGKTIAILDDVMTTGSTCADFSRALLEQGADHITVWCCARA